MLLHCCLSNSATALSSRTLFLKTSPKYNLPKKSSHCTCSFKFGLQEAAEIAHNKVLITAAASAAIGQLSKPFTSVILYGKSFDIKAAVQAGGFPSTHSSSVVAAATSLALERGFSDSIFGVTVVYAGLIMYDAQGVRREVGNHAKTLNEVVMKKKTGTKVCESIDHNSEGECVNILRKESSPVLKESIGHTEVEVVAGALLGFLVTLVVYSTL